MNLKRQYAHLLLFTLCFGCGKSDNECIPPAPKENIVGTWSASFVSKPEKISVVKFSNDGVYSEESNLLLGAYFSPVSSWSASNDTINIAVKYSNSATSKYQFVLAENSCNELLLEMEGLERVKLFRK